MSISVTMRSGRSAPPARRPTSPAARPRAGAALALLCAGVVCATPLPAAAQHEPFVRALVDFTTLLPGSYGDEGPEARALLDAMAEGLASWDRTLAEYESNVAAALPTATPQRALAMHTTMGALYVARNRLDAAMREYDAAARLAPDVPALHRFRALVHEAAGRPAEALEAFRTAWGIEPENPVTACLVADRSLRSGAEPRPDEPLATLSAAIDRMAAGDWRPAPEPFIDTALLPDRAVDTPLFVPALYARAYELFDRGRYAEMVDALRAAASEDPLLSATRSDDLQQGSAALRSGRVSEAIDRFSAAVGHASSPEAHRMLGVAYWAAAQYDRSITELQQAIRLRPSDERARLTLVRVFDEAGRPSDAERLLVETVDALPSSSLARMRLGRMYVSANRSADALGQLERVVPGVLTGKGIVLMEIGALYRRDLNAEAAVEAFSRVLEHRPNDGTAHRERARTLLQVGREDEAAVALAAALLVDPEDAGSYLTLGQMHLDAGRSSEAVRVLTRAVALDPDHPEARYALGNALVRAGQRDAAATHLQAFAELQAREREAQRRRIDLSVLKLEAALRADAGEFARAVELWERIVATETDVASNHAGLAAALAGAGQLDAAVAHFERALALNAPATVYRDLAALYEKMNRVEDARQTRARLARAQQDAFGTSGPTPP